MELEKYNLHSNLVQFKPGRAAEFRKSHSFIYIPIWYNSSEDCNLCGKQLNSIYIPIWYNSSLVIQKFRLYLEKIYIPIWYNSSTPNCGALFPMFSTPVSVYHDHIVNKNPFPVPFPNYRKCIFIGVFNPCRPRCIFTLS